MRPARMSVLQHHMLALIVLLCGSSTDVLISRLQMEKHLLGWGGGRTQAIYWLIDQGYVLEFYNHNDTRVYYGVIQEAIDLFSVPVTPYNPHEFYSEAVTHSLYE